MKTLQDYIKEYETAIKDAKPGQQVVKRPAYILAAWERDNHASPWLPGYEEKLEATGKVDPELLEELAEGINLFSDKLEDMLKQAKEKNLF